MIAESSQQKTRDICNKYLNSPLNKKPSNFHSSSSKQNLEMLKMLKGTKQRHTQKIDLAQTYLASMKTKNKQLKPLSTVVNDPHRHTTFNKQLKISVKAYRKSFLNCLNSNSLQQGYQVKDLQNEILNN